MSTRQVQRPLVVICPGRALVIFDSNIFDSHIFYSHLNYWLWYVLGGLSLLLLICIFSIIGCDMSWEGSHHCWFSFSELLVVYVPGSSSFDVTIIPKILLGQLEGFIFYKVKLCFGLWGKTFTVQLGHFEREQGERTKW